MRWRTALRNYRQRQTVTGQSHCCKSDAALRDRYILDTTGGAVRTEASFDTQDGLYDCAWSEENENHM